MRKLLCILPFMLAPCPGHAALCDVAWDGEAIAEEFAGMPLEAPISLQAGEGGPVHEVSLAQLRAFRDAAEDVARIARIAPQLVICADEDPNAFAFRAEERAMLAVTLGMLRLVDGARDEAAYIVGHEVAHHVRHHAKANPERDGWVALLSLVVAVVAQAKGGSYDPNAGINAGKATSMLAQAKFSRDEEREADELGLRYMVAAGYHPGGALRMLETLGHEDRFAGFFLDSHPGHAERLARVQALIASDPGFSAAASRPSAPNAAPIHAAPPSPEAAALFVEADRAARAREFEKAVALLRKSAGLGYARAEGRLGAHYASGYGVKRDDVEAVRLYTLAAERGDPAALWRLGMMYEFGRGGLPRDTTEAARLYRRAADDALPGARASLARFHEEGLGGLMRDPLKAARLYRLAANDGYAYAQMRLGAMYFQGGGIPVDEAEAARLFRLAADAGNAAAQVFLGVMYARGRGGLAKDEAEAVRWYELSVKQGHRSGQLRLGRMYAEGRGGLPKDEAKAMELFRLAAAQGDADAKLELDQRELGKRE